MFLIKLYINYLYSMLTDLYGSYSFQVTRESKWGQHSKFISFISGTILIVLFSLESVLNYGPILIFDQLKQDSLGISNILLIQ
jgi:hypothetical protein